MNKIKIYEPMGYLLTYGENSMQYYLPWKDIENIMQIISKGNGPKYLDLTKYGYGWESCSLIRGAKKIDQNESEIREEILKQNEDTREWLKIEIEKRKKNGLHTNKNIISNLLAEKLAAEGK